MYIQKLQNTVGGVSDYLNDMNITSMDCYIDKHIVQEALTFLNNSGLLINDIFSNIIFPEYIRVNNNLKEAYCKIGRASCRERV